MSPDIASALVGILEVKDLSTAAHTWRVIFYTRALAEDAGADADTLQRLTIAAAIHDIGKIEVPDHILQKPGPLTADEYEVMKTHAALGHDRLLGMGETDPILLDLVRHHHERWDGRGYPDGLAGNAIPAVARHFAVVDSFDALTSLRPYRADVGPDAARRAIAELHAGAGSHYEPDAVGAFTRLHNRGHLDWVLHYFNDSCPVPDYAALGDVNSIIPSRRL